MSKALIVGVIALCLIAVVFVGVGGVGVEYHDLLEYPKQGYVHVQVIPLDWNEMICYDVGVCLIPPLPSTS